MAKLLVAREIIEDLLFGYADDQVFVKGIESTGQDGSVVFDIEGAGVPDVPEVRAECTIRQNRAGQKFITMTFHPAT